MLLTLGAKYLYSNKNRDVSPDFEMYDVGFDWNDVLTWGPLILMDLFLLTFGLLMAIRLTKTRAVSEMALHVFFALFANVPYVFLNTIFNTPAYQTLK